MTYGQRVEDDTKAGSFLGLRHRPRRVLVFIGLLVLLSIGGWAAGRVWLAARQDPDELWEQAQSALSSGRLDQAEAILERLTRRRSPTLADRLLRAEVSRQRGQLERAIAALDGFPETEVGAALIGRTLGMLEFERDRARPAEAALLKALSMDAKVSEARRDLINLYSVQSRGRELSAQFRELSSRGSLSFADLYLWCLGRRPDVGPAELAAKLDRMLRKDPQDRETRLALAEDLRRLGRLDESEKTLAPLPAADADATTTRTRVALDRGDVEAAERLLADGPRDHAGLARLRGRLALSRGDAAATDHYRIALAAEPDDRDSLFGLGQALRIAGQTEAARPYFQAARDRDRLEWLIENARSLSKRDDPPTLRAIGDACRSLRHFNEARAWYRLALSAHPLDSELQKRLFEMDAAIEQEDHRVRTHR